MSLIFGSAIVAIDLDEWGMVSCSLGRKHRVKESEPPSGCSVRPRWLPVSCFSWCWRPGWLKHVRLEKTLLVWPGSYIRPSMRSSWCRQRSHRHCL